MSKLNRINVVVSPEQKALLAELGELQGRSSASYLREFLDGAEPVLRAHLPLLRQVAEKVALQPQGLQKAVREVLQTLDASRAQLDLLEHLATVQPHLANDDAADGVAAPSAARTDSPGRSRPKRSGGA